MGRTTKIEWCDHTFNHVRGCAHHILPDGTPHPGCDHCYAEAMSKRNPTLLGEWGEQGVRVCAAPEYWRQPEKWNHQAALDGCRRRVFCASLADVFEDWDALIHDHANAVLFKCRCGWQGTAAPHKDHPTGWRHCPQRGSTRAMTMDDMRSDLFDVIYKTQHLDWLLLTKRPAVAERWLRTELARIEYAAGQKPFANVWVGTSISDQSTADALVPDLLKLRDLAPVLFLSIEPLLGEVNLEFLPCRACNHPGNVLQWPCPHCRGRRFEFPDWVIVGGESGHHARPMHPDWVRSIRDQCAAANVPFFFKQWGEWAPPESIRETRPGYDPENTVAVGRVGKHAAGRTLDGREHSEFPVPCFTPILSPAPEPAQ